MERGRVLGESDEKPEGLRSFLWFLLLFVFLGCFFWFLCFFRFLLGGFALESKKEGRLKCFLRFCLGDLMGFFGN